MIRIEMGEEVHGRGRWRWKVPAMALEGFSRQPLLDACREIERTSGAGDRRVGLFREGRSTPDMTCTVRWGASKTVDEEGPWFKKWKPRPAELVNRKKEGKP
jgi:hypothetical protein